MPHEHFVSSNLPEIQETNCSPIDGYQCFPLLTLEQAVEEIIPLVPGIVDYVSTAKKKCNRNSSCLTLNESATIYLYSMPVPFFSRLNEALRAENRHALKPWFAYLKLFVTALDNLPSIKKTIWRGVSGDVGSIFADGDVHVWWSINSCSMALSVVKLYLGEIGTIFAIDAIYAKDISAYSAFPDEREAVLMPGTCVRAQCQSLNLVNRYFLFHLEEQTSSSESQSEANYLSEVIRLKHQQNACIERIMNPAKCIPIEQSYINLAIEESSEQQRKEKKLGETQLNETILNAFEELHGVKTSVDIKNIFETCNEPRKQVLIFGRAGIGKTTFCRYVAYQWAIGAILQQYQLVISVRLRSLTGSRYPVLTSGTRYCLIDLIKTQYFGDSLPKINERLLKEQLNSSQVLWLLDGYDEIVQNVPAHLEYVFKQLLQTPHHILTSRPYLNTLSYNVQLEIIGFTDHSISAYVDQFFNQIKGSIDNALSESKKLLKFLQCNPRIWGIVHIPVNLELICSLWCDTNWSETTTLTMTTVYDKMTEWLCRRHLKKQNISSSQMIKEDVYDHCYKELTFLESLAFTGMESDSIIIQPKFLRMASNESECSFQDQPHLLNIGMLKSLDYKPIGTHIEVDKTHYFLHLSFQEHFAARYLVKALNGDAVQEEKAINFIKRHKYNQRFELVFTFASGLLINSNTKRCINSFWNTMFGDPLDLVGLRHVQLVMSCIEESDCNRSLPQFHESINSIIKWIKYSVSKRHSDTYDHITASLRGTPLLVNQHEILDTLLELLKTQDPRIKQNVSLLISKLSIFNPHQDLIHSLLTSLNENDNTVESNVCDAHVSMNGNAAITKAIGMFVTAVSNANSGVKWSACLALRKIAEKNITNEVINGLVNALGNAIHYVRWCACEALEEIVKRVGTSQVIDSLINAVAAENDELRSNACFALGRIGETMELAGAYSKLVGALRDVNHKVRSNACDAFGKIGEKAAIEEVIIGLRLRLADENHVVRAKACEALGKMGEKAITNEVLDSLIDALEDENHVVRAKACEFLGKMGEQTATSKIINRLVSVLGHSNECFRDSVNETLVNMAEKVENKEMIDRLVTALENENFAVRSHACNALGKLGNKVASVEVINRLTTALRDPNHYVKCSAYEALGEMGKKAATNEVINSLIITVLDENDELRWSACNAVWKIGGTLVDNKVVNSLITALEHVSHGVRWSACFALQRMDKNAANDDVIKRLVRALGDANHYVRNIACETLENMSRNLATTEVIDSLVTALEDENCEVILNACLVLGKIGDKAATEKVIYSLVTALRNENSGIRSNVCKALGEISKNTPTLTVIDNLTAAVFDENYEVRSNACDALGKLGEKAVTNKAISALVTALGDRSNHVRRSACEALWNMGEQAGSTEVIDSLMTVMTDENDDVRSTACFALRKMCEITATNEMIDCLMHALEDENCKVTHFAFEALQVICTKRITNEVINKLLVALRNDNNEVRASICRLLGTIGEKAATSEVIEGLLDVWCCDKESDVRDAALRSVEDILFLCSTMSHLQHGVVSKLSSCVDRFKWKILGTGSSEKVVQAFLDTKISDWLSIIIKILLWEGNAITMTENTIVLYSHKEPVKLIIRNRKVGRQLKDALINWANESF